MFTAFFNGGDIRFDSLSGLVEGRNGRSFTQEGAILAGRGVLKVFL